MEFIIIWELFITAKNKDKCLKKSQSIIKSLGVDSKVAECESYWKDKSLFKVNLKNYLNLQDIEIAVFQVLSLSSCISRRWTVGAPIQYDGEKWEFSGWAIKEELIIQGISEASFKLSNFNK